MTITLSLPAWSQTTAVKRGIPPPVVPQGFGVNIHFTDPQAGEMERFSEAGYALVRMDLFWGGIEKEKGKYDFSAYDRLLGHLTKAGARPIFILDYGNDLYQKGSPSTPEARTAFAKFAAEAARHFQGKGVLFEIWNEPNIGFWQPKPNAAEYAALAVETAKAVRAADPNAVIFAPGSSGFPWEFFEEVFRSGLLALIDGVSVHPYRETEPETAGADYARLRALIARYAPPGKAQMPIISSEWGYSTRTGGPISETMQAQYLPRMWLTNLANGVNISIFYDWRDDGDDPKENEHRFGTVRRDFMPKPSFLAAQRLIRELRGYGFRHRLQAKADSEWRLLFQKGDSGELALVSWNAAAAPESERMPSVRRLKPEDKEYADLRRLAAIRFPQGAWAQGGSLNQPFPVVYKHYGPDGSVRLNISVGNPKDGPAGKAGLTGRVSEGEERTITIPGLLDSLRVESVTLPVQIKFNDKPLPPIAPRVFARVDPLALSVAPGGEDLVISVENPSGLTFKGKVFLPPTRIEKEIVITEGQTSARIFVPLPPSKQAFGARLLDERKEIAVTLPPQRFEPMPGWNTEGKPGLNRVLFVENAAQKQEPLTFAPTPDNSPEPMGLKFDYTFDKGWQYAQIAPAKELSMPKGVTAFVVWVLGDGSGNYLRARFKDATGQTFQKDLGQLVWRGWRPVTVALDGTGAGVSWGGANDRVPHAPLSWEGLLLVDSASRDNPTSGILFLASPFYILKE